MCLFVRGLHSEILYLLFSQINLINEPHKNANGTRQLRRYENSRSTLAYKGCSLKILIELNTK